MTETKTLEGRIECTSRGTLLQVFQQIADLSTIQEAHEVWADRRKEVLDAQGNVDTEKLRLALDDPLQIALDDPNSALIWYGYTADFPMYRLENEKGEHDPNGEAILYFAPRQHNLIFRHLDDAMDDNHPIKQVNRNQNYKPNAKEAQEVVDSYRTGETARVRLANLGLVNDNTELSHFVIDTVKYANSVDDGGLNDDERELAERAFGNGRAYDKKKGFSKEFKQSMLILKAARKRTTGFYFLNPNYVKQNAKDDTICYMSSLYNFDFQGNCSFDAAQWSFSGSYGGLRGVLKKAG